MISSAVLTAIMCDMSDICMTLIILISDLLPENSSQPASLSHRKQICQHCLFLLTFCYFLVLFLFLFLFFSPLFPYFSRMIPRKLITLPTGSLSLTLTERKRVLPNRASPLSLNQFSILSRSRLVRPGSSSPGPAASSSTRLRTCLVLCY